MPIFKVEFDSRPMRFVSLLEQQGWFEALEVTSPRSFTVHVKDIEKAKDLLPRIAAGDDANLTRYELVSPTLEEILVRMVNG